jgi:outer membrane protein assembly factor BamA
MMVVFIVSATNLSYAQESEKNKSESDSTSKREMSLDGYPYIYYTPETELAFGVGGIMVFYTADDTVVLPSKVVLGGYYSTKAQYKVTLDPAFYFNDNKLFINMPLSFGYFVDKYFGIGPNSPDDGDEDYISRVYTATLYVQIPSYWFTSDRTGLILDYNYTEMVDKQANQELIDNSVIGSNGGTFFGMGIQAVWDSRDNLFFPNDGKYSSLKILSYPMGDFNFYTFEMDVRNYTSFSEDHVLAGQAFFTASGGDIPFYKIPSMGGQNRMRGYYYGRYRDNVYFTIQLEYRQYFWWRLGYVLFGGVGGVADSPDKLKIDELKFSYGAGLRFLFNEEQKVNIRMDFGIGRNGSTGIYFGIEEAF